MKTKVEKPQQAKPKIKNNRESVTAILLIMLGLLFLMKNFGLLPQYLWSSCWKLWPIVLIMVGLKMATNKSTVINLILAILGFILVIFFLRFALAITL